MLRSSAWGTDPLLPRAFSLLQVDGDNADILVKANGKASSLLETVRPGTRFELLGPLGNSFPNIAPEVDDWWVAGGVGLAPLLMQAQKTQKLLSSTSSTALTGRGRMFYGGRTKEDLVMLDDLKATGFEITLVTEDGSLGEKGYVTDALLTALKQKVGNSPRLLACGPDPMLHAVKKIVQQNKLSAFLSLEGEMACGIGACLVCAVACKSKPFQYACIDGPVFDCDELADSIDQVGEASAGAKKVK